MKYEKIEQINADMLSQLWDDGFENNSLDPGDIFDKTIRYCYGLENKCNSNAIKFTEWVYENRYSKYWGSDEPNNHKWYKQNTMPDRTYYTTEELYQLWISLFEAKQ
jgi:hypothetical protein